MSHDPTRSREQQDRVDERRDERSRFRIGFDFSCLVSLGLNEITCEASIDLTRIGSGEPEVRDFELRFASVSLLVRNPSTGITVLRLPLDLKALQSDDERTFGLLSSGALEQGLKKAHGSQWKFDGEVERE